jgi:hypothetical protein
MNAGCVQTIASDGLAQGDELIGYRGSVLG